MPTRPKSPCTWPRCPERLPRPGRCERHRRGAWTTATGMQPTVSPYGNAWRGVRAEVLAEERTCRHCGAPATEVDHVTPLAHGGTHERRNLQGLCVRCHRAKTQRDALDGRRRNRAAPGGVGRRNRYEILSGSTGSPSFSLYGFRRRFFTFAELFVLVAKQELAGKRSAT